MSDEFKSQLSELKNSEPMRPDTEFVNRTRQKLINHNLRSTGKKTKKIFPVFSILLLFPIAILLLIPVDFSKLTTSGYNALKPIGFQTRDQTDVYIYHTHSYEYLLPTIENNVPKPPSKSDDTVNDVGTYLTMYLENLDLSVTHDKTDFVKKAEREGDDFSDLYDHSRKNLIKFFNEAEESDKTILIDLHLDSSERNLTTTTINGKDTARIVFNISTLNPNYESNLQFAKRLHQLLENKYPGISRGIVIKGERGVTVSTYNQDLSSKALLISIGGDENTLEEEKRATKILAEILKNELE